MIKRPNARRTYRNNLVSSGILETDVHREFVKGQHGLKLEFDRVYSRRRSGLYLTSLVLKADLIAQQLDGETNIAIVGIANGALQHGRDLSLLMNSMPNRALTVTSLDSRKYQQNGQKIVELTKDAQESLAIGQFDLVVLDDDVGTTGSSTAQPVPEIRRLGVPRILAAYDWIRAPRLPILDAEGVPYFGIVEEEVANYAPDDCQAQGLCAQGVPLIDYGQETS